jgi:hypothetical protein
LVGECSALRDGRDVGTVVGEDRFKHISGFGDVVAVGDDAQLVVVASAGGSDVQPSSGRGGGDEETLWPTVSDW